MTQELPNWREKKEGLWKEGASPDDQVETGDAFFAADRFSEALDFYVRAAYREGVEKVRKEAVARGDWFLFKACRVFLGGTSPEDAKTLARNAFESGKFLFAVSAYRDIGDREAVEKTLLKIREVFPDSEILLETLDETGEGAAETLVEEEGGGRGEKKK
jgi:hypothetical protein